MPTEAWLIESQRELELEAIDLGVNRYRRWKERGDLGRPELQLVGFGIKRIEESVQSVKDKIVSGEMRAGTGFLTWAPLLLYFPADMLAGAALMATIESIIKSGVKAPSRQAVVMAIGAAVETMFHLLKAKEMDKDLFNILRKTIKHWDGRRARRFYSKVTGLNRAFDMEERALIGGFLFAHVLTTGWFTIAKNKRDAWQVLMDPEVSAELAKQHEQLELLSPMLYPLVIPPADWDQEGKGGGYIYHRHDLFKPVNPGDRPPKFENAPAVIEAMNNIQRTEWCVDKQVLAVQQAVWAEGGGVGGMVRLEPWDVEKEVPREEGISDERLIECKRKRELLHRANAEDVGTRLEHLWRLRAAHRMSSYPSMFHSWQMDWRGRIYPRACVLTPQGNDLDRGLLRFARAIPQTDDGRRWLRIHLANCWGNDGVDKAPYPARIAWVDIHEDRIRAVASDPLRYRWWLEAEHPWMFLAACFEFVRTDGLTQLPVSVDGTCNGLQHYSAIGRDEIGGAAVNLVPGPAPRDIYAEVAAAMRRILATKVSFIITKIVKAEGKAQSVRVEIARPWLPEITRKVSKRGTMTYPYGLTPIGMRDQFLSKKRNERNETVYEFLEGAPEPFVSATILRDLMQEAIGQVVVKAVELMAYLKAMAKVANDKGIPLQWAVPTGMVITQDYVVPQVQRLRLPGLGQLDFRVISEEQRELHKQKQINGVCPNIIHSFDAAHLMLTVNAGVTAGIIAFWLVHDSYGVHAPHVPTLQRVLREQFVGMYDKENVIVEIKCRNEVRLGCPLPDPPPVGGLDLKVVLDSEYAFG